MNKDSILIAVVALIIGLFGGYLIFSISNSGTSQQQNGATPTGTGSPVDYSQRISQAEKVVAQDPKNLNAWISLGNDYFDMEQPQKSINAYGKALEIEPNNPDILTDQGIMFRKVGWYDKALTNFEKAGKIEPNHLQSLYNIGLVYAVDLKQPEKATSYWRRYLQLDSSSQTAMQIKSMMAQPNNNNIAPAMK
ncbi:MAG: tetratricopeptide repeat protein [Desulfuromonadaceae bacterium]|nr:tetratricopeptide repeat protein [Desulfuromonadaceae bacterium]MDD2849690.1 tetratricopeptide repeat protein [Desulfuromonadaceae bacterium]MDD4129793.1 tetratricopeptide repeat protein [Desulfuromonadaceae bacterium]